MTFEIEGKLRDVYNCHCSRCRKITGHHMAATAVNPNQFTFVTFLTMKWYNPTPTVHYGFCGVCGATLLWRADEDPDKLCIAAGSLDQPTGLRTTRAWWVSEAGDYHERPAGITEYDVES